MSDTEIANLIIQTAADTLSHLTPTIGVLAGINLVLGWITNILFRIHSSTKD